MPSFTVKAVPHYSTDTTSCTLKALSAGRRFDVILSANNDGPCGAGADMQPILSADTSQKYVMACQLTSGRQVMP